jgi:hypothetical protein
MNQHSMLKAAREAKAASLLLADTETTAMGQVRFV